MFVLLVRRFFAAAVGRPARGGNESSAGEPCARKLFLGVTWTMFVLLVRRFLPVSHRRAGTPSAAGEGRPHSLSRKKVLHLSEHSLVLQRRFSFELCAGVRASRPRPLASRPAW